MSRKIETKEELLETIALLESEIKKLQSEIQKLSLQRKKISADSIDTWLFGEDEDKDDKNATARA